MIEKTKPGSGPIRKRFAPIEQARWKATIMILVDKATRHGWVYGLKNKSEVFSIIRRFWANTSQIRNRHPLLCRMRDNAGENSSM